MEANLNQERRYDHALLDMLPTEAEEEEITLETAAALHHARASLARGEGIPHDEILREFGRKE
jgi:hypothetical protein